MGEAGAWEGALLRRGVKLWQGVGGQSWWLCEWGGGRQKPAGGEAPTTVVSSLFLLGPCSSVRRGRKDGKGCCRDT